MTKFPLKESTKNNIIAIVGMAGSGKTEAGNFFRKKNCPVLRFGDVIDDGIKAEGLPWTPENNVYYRAKIREELGMAAVAIKMLPKIEQNISNNPYVFLDGLYSWEEYTYIRDHFPQIFLLCIYARPALRYARLAQRKERTFNRTEAIQRDIHEIEKIHKAGPIAFADYLIKNESTKKELDERLEEFWQTFQLEKQV